VNASPSDRGWLRHVNYFECLHDILKNAIILTTYNLKPNHLKIMSLDRLIDLASRTGDRLIVHNPIECQDVVIMSIDEYENLIDSRHSVRGLSSNQLLDQINRDISVWRSSVDQDEDWEKTRQLEDEIMDEEIGSMPFGAPWNEPWHRAGEILSSRYQSRASHQPDPPDYFGVGESELEGEGMQDGLAGHFFEEDDFSTDDRELSSAFLDDSRAEELDAVWEEIGFPFDDGADDKIHIEDIPFRPATDDVAWEEEPLPSEEPVFYEEPV
jgi:hypothetical protein